MDIERLAINKSHMRGIITEIILNVSFHKPDEAFLFMTRLVKMINTFKLDDTNVD